MSIQGRTHTLFTDWWSLGAFWYTQSAVCQEKKTVQKQETLSFVRFLGFRAICGSDYIIRSVSDEEDALIFEADGESRRVESSEEGLDVNTFPDQELLPMESVF